jgi:hypothetical protein
LKKLLKLPFLEVIEQAIKPKFNPRRKMISTSVGGVVVASVKLMASPEPKVSQSFLILIDIIIFKIKNSPFLNCHILKKFLQVFFNITSIFNFYQYFLILPVF